jgi:hypothetical protein
MKFFKLAPIAGLLIASSAFAAEPTADIKIYAAGASAQLGSISGILTSLCVPNDATNKIEFYEGYGSSTGASGTAFNTNLRAFRCKLKTGDTPDAALDGKTVLFSYSAIGGSASGVQYVARQLNRKFINFDACPATPVAATALTSITPAGSLQYKCDGLGVGALSTTTTQDQKPSAGSSDVEPARFVGDNAPVGETSVNNADLAALVVKPSRAVIFGVYANQAMWTHLQTRQGITPIMPVTSVVVSGTTLANAVIQNTPTVGFDESKRPNITKAEYRALVKGDMTDLQFLAGTDAPVASPPSALVQVARRVKGSGSQAMSNIFFLNNSCGNLTTSAYTPAAAITSATYVVTEGNGSSNVLNELQTKNNAVVGVLSLESPERGQFTLGSTTYKPFGLLKIDGISPSRANVVNGKYEFFAEETFQWNKNVIASGSAQEKFLNRYVNEASTVSTLLTLAADTQAGVAALADYNGFTALPQPGIPAGYIMNSTRNGNNCAPAVKIVE